MAEGEVYPILNPGGFQKANADALPADFLLMKKM
jgi:hypothetical protein